MNKYVLIAVAAIVVLGAIWFYTSRGGETIIGTTPAQQEQTPSGTTK